MQNRLRALFCLLFATGALLMTVRSLEAQEDEDEQSPTSVLTDAQWDQLDDTVDRALEYLATKQEKDGSFQTDIVGQPVVTSFCVMAFLSRGHTPTEGPYAKQLSRAIDFVLSQQQANGLLCSIKRGNQYYSNTGSYNHAINGLMLCEVYGMTSSKQQKAIRSAIEKALAFSRTLQTEPKRWAGDKGGWRYLNQSHFVDSDLSVTSWYLMFYRSARNAEFDIPAEYTSSALEFVKRCYFENPGTFRYGLRGPDSRVNSRCMAGAGVVSLALAGEHNSEMARKTGDFILEHPFTDFNRGRLTREDRYFYGVFYCSQATYQLGSEYFVKFFPDLLQTMADNQNPDGSWAPEINHEEKELGMVYSTSFAVLGLTPPYQLLPIFQR